MVERHDKLYGYVSEKHCVFYEDHLPNPDGLTPVVTLSDYAALEAQLAEARKALGMMLKEHDILSGNFGDVMDPKHKRPDRWPTAAEAARRALEGSK